VWWVVVKEGMIDGVAEAVVIRTDVVTTAEVHTEVPVAAAVTEIVTVTTVAAADV